MTQEKLRYFGRILSSGFIEKTARKYGAQDTRQRKLTLVPFFWLAIFSHFHKAENGFLNILVSRLVGSFVGAKEWSKSKGVKTISRIAISKQFCRRSWKLFRDVFNYLLKAYRTGIPEKKRRLFSGFVDVIAVDASVVYMCKLLQKLYRATKKAKAALKMHVKYSVVNFVSEDMKVTSETTNKREYEFILKAANLLYIFSNSHFGLN